jgi:maltose-binding protein MalE
MVKMKKPGKKKALTASWEGPYLFVAHTDGVGNLDFEEGSRICIVQVLMGANGKGLIETFKFITSNQTR